MRKIKIALLVLSGFVSLFVFDAFSETKKIKPQYYKSGISHQNLISSSLYNYYTVEKLAKISSYGPDTLRILAIRVEFQTDNDRRTTGNGEFILTAESEYSINRPPHNKAYFEHQLSALANYFQTVSENKLILNSEVYPQGQDDVYTLPYQMSYYNPNTTDEELDIRLAELFRDAFVAANSDNAIDFSKYDSFIIFHAGVGAEYTLELDTTPQDIPSVFLNFQDLKSALAPSDSDFDGIHVRDKIIVEGIILPETENQMGYDIGLLGTMTLMFGHQIGLPNLYETESGRPGIGVFGMMDQGSANFFGLLPAQPCAWSKIFLGWEEPVVINSGTFQISPAVLEDNIPKIYKIPINAREYYLIENRQRHALRSQNTTIGYDDKGLRIEFKEDGELTPPSPGDTIGVIVQVDEYDFGLPGSGILIWHIDENIIEMEYQTNSVNNNPGHRGVDLVEADGAQDMGEYFNFFGITGYEAGTEWDMWWSDNEAFSVANDSAEVALTPYTMPNSNANSGARSNIFITDFSDRTNVMSFFLAFENYHTNFPQKTASNLLTNSILTGDLDGSGTGEIIAASQDGFIYIWQADGSKFIENEDSLTVIDLLGNTSKIPFAISYDINAPVDHTPAITDLNNDGAQELIVASTNGVIHFIGGYDNDSNGRADLISSFDSGAMITTVPVVLFQENKLIVVGHDNGTVTAIHADGSFGWLKEIAGSTKITGIAKYSHNGNDSLVVTSETGTIYFLGLNGDVIWERSLPNTEHMGYPAVADLDGDGSLDIVVGNQKGTVGIFDKTGNEIIVDYDFETDSENYSNPVIADLNNDGYAEILFTGDGKIIAYNYRGMPVENFPVELHGAAQSASVDPIIADLDGNNDAEIIVATDYQVYAFHHTGQRVSNFPFSVGGKIFTSPMLSDIDGDGMLNLAVCSLDGFVNVWDMNTPYNEQKIFWGGYLHDAEHSGLFKSGLEPEVVSPNELMPVKTVYNWPNPNQENFTYIHYWLKEAADVTIRIYDMAGDLVDELTGTGFPQIDNNVRFDLTSIQSGVYITRVEAANGSQNSVAFFKMAVVK